MNTKNRTKINPIDQSISDIINKFSQIKNFNHLYELDDDNKIINFLMVRFTELENLKNIYKNSFIPAINKDISKTYNLIETSIYRQYINKDLIREYRYETIRMGYVQLFHKIENFYKDLLSIANLIFSNEDDLKIEEYYRKNNTINISKNWKNIHPSISKINWICNCVKHHDGYPSSNFPDEELKLRFANDKRIIIECEELYKDIEDAKGFYQSIMDIIFILGMYKMTNSIIMDTFVEDYAPLNEKKMD